MTTEKISMHPSSEMLLNHAMGNSSEVESLIILGHVAYCPECKAELAKYENIGGAYLNNNETVAVSDGLFDSVFKGVLRTTILR